jgi:hypothetical protein
MPSHSTGTVHRPSIELAVVCFFRAAAAAPVRPGPAARTHAHATHCCPASPAFLIQALEPTPNLVLHVPLVSERPGPIVLAIAFAFAFAFDIAIAIAAGSRLRFAVCRCAPACLPACSVLPHHPSASPLNLRLARVGIACYTLTALSLRPTTSIWPDSANQAREAVRIICVKRSSWCRNPSGIAFAIPQNSQKRASGTFTPALP